MTVKSKVTLKSIQTYSHQRIGFLHITPPYPHQGTIGIIALPDLDSSDGATAG